MEIKNIFCIGRNYVKHAEELGNEVPKQPILFSKPTHALTKADGRVLSFPKLLGEIHHELEIVLHIHKNVEKGDLIEDVVDKMALGIDLTLRDLQSELKRKGQPWLRAKGFRESAILTDFWDFPGIEECKKNSFSLTNNSEIVQKGTINEMIFSFQMILDELIKAFGVKAGDIIFTGTPEGVGPLEDGDDFSLYWNEKKVGNFLVDRK
ncbi:fumarylacetoacetate hydrolase family protein [Alkalihalobacillus trypoxylicola]|uniref:Fumarylacetoacetate hydrolase n=1 Tax=Alkalihalobacillus trypoxylicola TaxID=519424 RepID=A0A162E5L6_9BACI|nr:fumarylacetoacetate hydrolase family protein [Alkalihalobacillus trypoxylicola]KYG31792.1 fumarylacetoacetate hydrolase [Alkalihalobacillus trypoxylicola]